MMKNKLNLSSAHVESVQIGRCHRLGPNIKNPKRPRTLIIKIQWYGDRMKIL